MVDHEATWGEVEGAGAERFPDDELATEIVVREAFDVEEAAAYAADLDAQVEEQGVLKAACAATRLRDELRHELREEGSGASGNDDDNDYLYLVDDLDADFLADLPTDTEAAEAVAKQMALMASFEARRHDQSAR
jgi:hypothetical protein